MKKILVPAIAAMLTMGTFAGVAAGAADKAPVKTPEKKPLTPMESWLADQQTYLRENYFHKDWKKTADGLQYLPKTLVPGNGPHPAPNSLVTVNYFGSTIDGNIFDSTFAKHQTVTIALNETIKGWQEGIAMMREGETWNFVVPAELGYGDAQTGPIPAGSVLIFQVELVKFAPPTH